jgi:tetratricopeptide (TPR) repeat protein
MIALVMIVAFWQPMGAQSQSAAANLANGITQLQAGDFFRAVLTLNDVVTKLSNQPAESTQLARAHAYRAMAYLGLDQSERARAAVLLALAADPGIRVDAGTYTPAVLALFNESRRPVSANPEIAGQDAEQAGRVRDAFLLYLTAYQALTVPAPATDDRRLRERIIKVVKRLDTAPAIPPEARERAARADALLEAEAILGTAGASSQAAATELRAAVRSAPWWPEATFKLASVLQKLQRVDEALLNLDLYKLADPAGFAATVARVTPPAVSAAPAAPAPAAPPRSLAAAVIYVYWPEQARGSQREKVLCNARHVADLQNSRFVMLKVTPGTHTVTFDGKDITAIVEGGREYYYRASAEGYPRVRPVIRLMSAAEATAEIQASRTTINDAARTFSTECLPTPAPGVRPRPR